MKIRDIVNKTLKEEVTIQEDPVVMGLKKQIADLQVKLSLAEVAAAKKRAVQNQPVQQVAQRQTMPLA